MSVKTYIFGLPSRLIRLLQILQIIRNLGLSWVKSTNCLLISSLVHKIYALDKVRERHRHRYEFNNRYLESLEAAGMVFSGFSDDGLVEVIELPEHPWFLACQFHPEFTSNPRDGHALFASFISAARTYQGLKLPRVAGV